MTRVGMTFSRYFFVFIAIIDRANILFNKLFYMLQVPLLAHDIYNIILQPLYIFTDFFDICHKQVLMHGYIKFGQLSVTECVNYKQCLNSLRTALIHM